MLPLVPDAGHTAQGWLFALLGFGLALGWSLLFSYFFLLEQKCLSCAYPTFISWKHRTYLLQGLTAEFASNLKGLWMWTFELLGQ